VLNQRFGEVDLITYLDLLRSQVYDHRFRIFCPVVGFAPTIEETLIPSESRRSTANESPSRWKTSRNSPSEH
jgi:hypothetical protein